MANDVLPEKYRFSHDYCFFLHDQLVTILKDGVEAEIFNISVRFKKHSQDKAVQGLSGAEFIDFLEKNGYKQEAFFLYYKQACRALLSDFLHFIYEALQCSKKGKLTVAYALLRKPFKENLLYLEWMLAEPGDFLIRFTSDKYKYPKFTFPQESTEKETKGLIYKALSKTKYAKVFDASLLYDLRFNKRAYLGLEPLWQQANHLVTTYRFLETSPKNFNFIFANSSNKIKLWDTLYTFLPILLYYSTEVVEAVIATFAKRDESQLDVIPLRTSIGMYLHIRELGSRKRIARMGKNLRMSLRELRLPCQKCGKLLSIDLGNLRRIYENGVVKCYKCKCLSNLSDYSKY